MHVVQKILNQLKKPINIIFLLVALSSVVLAGLSYNLTTKAPPVVPTPSTLTNISTPTPSPTVAATVRPTQAVAQPIILPPQDPSRILGLDGGSTTNADKQYPGVSWIRLSHPTCGWGNLKGQTLKTVIQYYHSQGVRVLFVVCQSNGMNIDSVDWTAIGQAYPDAVQCGNEEMKQDVAAVSFLYMSPQQFAHFYDRCESAVHAVNPKTPTLVGSLDPHVAGPDYQLMMGQVNYLDQMQATLNATRSKANWNWHNQALGVIDSWYNGYNGANNVAGVFDFWAQQFNVSRNGGQLGKHLWVVEGTGCYKGCGINQYDPAEVAMVHVLTLVTDIQTSMQAKVPFFQFSGKDIQTPDDFGPTGVQDIHGHAKPLRQDLPMGSVTLTLTCPGNKSVNVVDQFTLLVKMYSGCALPSDYFGTLTN